MTGHQVSTSSGAGTMTSTSSCPVSSALRKPKDRPWRRRLGWVLVACAFGGFAYGEAPQSSLATNSCEEGDRALAASQWDTARNQYTTCLAAEPPRFEVLSNLAMALTRMGRMDEAIQTYREALVLSSGNPKVRFNLALALIKVGNYEDAAGQLARLKRAGSSDPRVPELLAFCDYHLERYSLASREAEQVYRAHPEDAANALILGSAYTRMGLYQKALPLITFALQSAGSADGHLIMGQTLLGLRLYHPAMDELSQAAELQSDLRGLHSALGVAKVGLGDSDGAALEFTEALKADPNDFQANYYLGRLRRLDGDNEAARKYLTKAEQLHPGAPEVIFEFAAIAMTERDYAKAEPLLGRVLRRQPDHIEAHFLLSDLYRRTGRKQAAQKERDVFERLRQKEQERQPAKTSSSVNPPSTSTDAAPKEP